jgi:hypothetical protein
MLTAILYTISILFLLASIVVAVLVYKGIKDEVQAEYYCKYNELTKCYETCCNYCNIKSECDCCCGGNCKACGGLSLRKKAETK